MASNIARACFAFLLPPGPSVVCVCVQRKRQLHRPFNGPNNPVQTFHYPSFRLSCWTFCREQQPLTYACYPEEAIARSTALHGTEDRRMLLLVTLTSGPTPIGAFGLLKEVRSPGSAARAA